MRSRAQEGFTLVETLVTVVITGIIGGAVVASIIIGLRTTDATANRLADSRDAQLAAAYFGTDVQAADRVSVGPASSPSAPSCAPTVPRIVDLIDDQVGGSGAPSIVTYVTETTGGRMNLRRLACQGTDVVADVVVAADLLDASPPLATCDPSCSADPAPVERVKMTVSVRGCSASESNCREGIDGSPYKYELFGATRSTLPSTASTTTTTTTTTTTP